jgi:MFS family permease
LQTHSFPTRRSSDLTERYRMSDSALGILFSLGSLTTGIACLVGPRLVGNLGGKVRTIVLGQGVSLVFLLAIGFSPWPWLAVVGFLVRGALMNMVAPLFDAFALEQTHESEHGAVNSIRNLAWNVGWTVGPYVSGVVQQRWGFSPLFISTAILYAIAISLTWFFFRSKAVASRQEIVPVS